jgi:hypothetical protein
MIGGRRDALIGMINASSEAFFYTAFFERRKSMKRELRRFFQCAGCAIGAFPGSCPSWFRWNALSNRRLPLRDRGADNVRLPPQLTPRLTKGTWLGAGSVNATEILFI